MKKEFVSWVLDYKKHLKVTLPVLIVVLSFVVRFSLQKGRHDRDFFVLKDTYAKWEKGDQERFHMLQTLLKKHPEIGPSYDNLIIQKLFASNDWKGAQPFLKKVFSRQQSPFPYFKQFTKTSCSIAEGNMMQALEEAISLKNNMIQDNTIWTNHMHFGSILFVFNLVRIAMLFQEVDITKEEKRAWKELKQLGGWIEDMKNRDLGIKLDPKAFKILLSHFTDHQISLLDYIEYRENLIR